MTKDTRHQVTKAELEFWAAAFLAMSVKFIDTDRLDRHNRDGRPSWSDAIDKANEVADYMASLYQVQEDCVRLVPGQVPSWPDEDAVG